MNYAELPKRVKVVLSTDTKDTEAGVLSKYIETDTGIKSEDVGDFVIPEYYHEQVTTTAAAALTVNNTRTYSNAIVVISGLTTETGDITGLSDGGTSQALTQYTNGTAGAAATLGNGTYYLKDLACADLVFTKSAAVESVTIDVDIK